MKQEVVALQMKKKDNKTHSFGHSQKVCDFFYFEKCANFRKMSIYEGYFIQLKPKFSMWLV